MSLLNVKTRLRLGDWQLKVPQFFRKSIAVKLVNRLRCSGVSPVLDLFGFLSNILGRSWLDWNLGLPSRQGP